MRSVAEAAYLAGFFDGEGTISTSKFNGLVCLRMLITNTDQVTLQRLQTVWGGRLRGKGKGKNAKAKLVFVLAWGAVEAANILREIQPYLRIKREHCVVALQFRDTMHPERSDKLGLAKADRKRRVGLYNRLKELNRRGVNHEC